MTVVVCAECAGLTFALVTCQCVDGGDRFLLDGQQPGGQPYRDCLICQGHGVIARACDRCDQRGLVRAQLVFTVVYADTGAVASASVTAGGIEPTPTSDGRWELALTPIVAELADTVGATTLLDISSGWRPLGTESIPLPREWRPDLPVDRRDAMVAAAFSGRSSNPWRVFHGRSVAMPPPDLDARLGRLCRLADQLLLDLVIEARDSGYGRLDWDVRYETPGVPDGSATHRVRGDDLPSAVAASSVADAFDGFEPRGLDAPAHYPRAGVPPPDPPEPGYESADLDQVERRIVRDCEDRAGAQAIWRNGRWWHTSLRPGRMVETLTERPTGQVARRLRTVLVRGWEPPAPDWLGRPIPYHDCPDCDPDSRLRACSCTLGGNLADPECGQCAGAGASAQHLPCYTCRDSRRVYHGAAVTVTDLAGRVIHENWAPRQPGGVRVDAPLVATQPGGKPVVQLPERYRLARLARQLDQCPDDLTELDGGHQLDQDLRDGIVTLHHPGDDPLAAQIALATRGRPGGRLLLAAQPTQAPPLTELIGIALGLHLAIAITVRDHRLDAGNPLRIHGERWKVAITAVDPATPPTEPPSHRSLPAAVADCLTYLELALAALVPADPHQLIPVPQTVRPRPVDDPTPLLVRLGQHHPGKPVTVRLDRAGCAVELLEYGLTHVLAKAETLPALTAALGLPATG